MNVVNELWRIDSLTEQNNRIFYIELYSYKLYILSSAIQHCGHYVQVFVFFDNVYMRVACL